MGCEGCLGNGILGREADLTVVVSKEPSIG